MVRTKTNKSAAIKEALKANADKGPKEIAEMLTKQGLKVTAMYVSNIKGKMGTKKKRMKGKRGPKPGSKRSDGIFADVRNTIVFVKGVGGLDKAKQLIALLDSARSM